MPRVAQLSVRGFGRRWRSGSEMLGGLGQRLFEGLGVALVVASLLLLLALLTYNPGDVSLDTAVDAPTRNFLGPDGALIADVLIQSVGLAAYLVPTVTIGWAFRLMLGRPIRRPLRGIALVLLALVLGAASCSILRTGLEFPAGAGGIVGWALVSLAERAGFAALVLPLAMAAAALVALLLVVIIGLTPGDWRELGSGAGRGATRFARASGRGTVATAALGQRLIRRWHHSRLARREAARPRPPWAAPIRPAAASAV
ncbi:MAG TPA: DNA translocase FtsK 4TM domain-containing protein, partial [Stellaceae bacterium]|nr:DNA translocase FtsK 4TM domain-containing protein [Stellaceae bacterium]